MDQLETTGDSAWWRSGGKLDRYVDLVDTHRCSVRVPFVAFIIVTSGIQDTTELSELVSIDDAVATYIRFRTSVVRQYYPPLDDFCPNQNVLSLCLLARWHFLGWHCAKFNFVYHMQKTK